MPGSERSAHSYDAPGRADVLSGALRAAWQDTIAQAYADALTDFPATAGRFVSGVPAAAPATPVTWLPVPRQVVGCLGRSAARELCDAQSLHDAAGKAPMNSLQGGREWQNEYCEYRVLGATDQTGRWRPKRVELTTELREYWLCLATHAPWRVLELAREVLRDPSVSFEDLYGQDPGPLTTVQRSDAFVRTTAGSATRSSRIAPSGRLNRERALFMCHPINGLDDVFFITLFGAQAFARRLNGRLSPVPLPWIFLDSPYFRGQEDNLRQLRDTYCRNADPAVCSVAYAAAYAGHSVALADPPGVYLRPQDFDADALRFQGTPIGALGWITWRRPDDGDRHQRLEIGPPEGEEIFLDDIEVHRGSQRTPLLGGFQILELLSVGPDVVVDPEGTELTDDDYKILSADPGSIPCAARNSVVCGELHTWQQSYLAREQVRATTPLWHFRRMARRDAAP